MSIDEASSSVSTPMNAALRAGLEALDNNQTVTFVLYVRLVLPLDGFVFWVRADLVSKFALFKTLGANLTTQRLTFDAPGSLHVTSQEIQEEDEAAATNRIVFTSEVELTDFSATNPNLMYIANFQSLRFAFSLQNAFYVQASLYHYVGDALNPAIQTQIIDDPAQFDNRQVVSNSLPFWLALDSSNPLFPYRATPRIMLYPSFAVPENLSPPYGAVHIIPETTTALQMAPYFDSQFSHYQLVRERVRVTFYGSRNYSALDFQDYVDQYTLDTGNFGIMNAPIWRDEKRTQPELGILAQKKTVDFDINYYQTRANTIARQLILSCIVSYQPSDIVQ